jgi:hypothetical protein
MQHRILIQYVGFSGGECTRQNAAICVGSTRHDPDGEHVSADILYLYKGTYSFLSPLIIKQLTFLSLVYFLLRMDSVLFYKLPSNLTSRAKGHFQPISRMAVSSSSSATQRTISQQIYTHPPQHGAQRAELLREGPWTHIDDVFVESIDLTSESADGSFSPKMDGVDGMVGAEGAAGTSHLSSCKSWHMGRRNGCYFVG